MYILWIMGDKVRANKINELSIQNSRPGHHPLHGNETSFRCYLITIIIRKYIFKPWMGGLSNVRDIQKSPIFIHINIYCNDPINFLLSQIGEFQKKLQTKWTGRYN